LRRWAPRPDCCCRSGPRLSSLAGSWLAHSPVVARVARVAHGVADDVEDVVLDAVEDAVVVDGVEGAVEGAVGGDVAGAVVGHAGNVVGSTDADAVAAQGRLVGSWDVRPEVDSSKAPPEPHCCSSWWLPRCC